MIIKKPIYPKTPHELDIRRKLSDSDIKEIRKMRKNKFKLNVIAKKFEVSYTTIKYWTSEIYRQLHIANSNKYTLERYYLNPVAEAKIRLKAYYRKKKIMPIIFRNYLNKYSLFRYYQNRRKIKN